MANFPLEATAHPSLNACPPNICGATLPSTLLIGALPEAADDLRRVPQWPLASLPARERLQRLLFEAACLGRADMIRPLLLAGVDLEARDASGRTALFLASYFGSLGSVQVLLREGAHPDTSDLVLGNTALIASVFRGFGEITACLIAGGARTNLRNRAGQTALRIAALFGHAAIAEVLIAAGSEPTVPHGAGNCARSFAAEEAGERVMIPSDIARPVVGGRPPAVPKPESARRALYEPPPRRAHTALPELQTRATAF